MIRPRRPGTGRAGASRSRGQALVEFSLGFGVFALILLSVWDCGRAIFAFNGVSEASRNVARAASTSCFEGTTNATRCQGADVTAAQASQGGNLPGAATWFVQCVDPFTGAPPSGRVCRVGDYVSVRATTSFTLITPVVAQAFGDVNVSSTSQVEILK
jgi:Flp pilus assembly protein TadG